MEYAAGVKKAQYNKVKLENRKMLIKPSYLITAVGIAFCVAFTVYGMQKGLFTSQEAMEQFLKPFGIWGPLIFVLIQVVQVVVPIIPGGVSCLGGVLLFGPLWGFIYNYVGICIGSACAFLISRRLGMKAVERAADGQKYGKYLKWMENGTFDKWFALAIFFPAAPDDLLCFLAGVTSMSFKKFLIIILLGNRCQLRHIPWDCSCCLRRCFNLSDRRKGKRVQVCLRYYFTTAV